MRRALLLLATTLLLGSCGGSDPSPAPPSAEDVIRAWADDLRRGDVDGATARFAVPAIVANNTPQIRLETRAQVRFFNATLPCGGKVVATERRKGLVVATFELTDRPGGDCGSGTGHRAKTAFEVRDGRIVKWLRVPLEGERQAPSGGPEV